MVLKVKEWLRKNKVKADGLWKEAKQGQQSIADHGVVVNTAVICPDDEDAFEEQTLGAIFTNGLTLAASATSTEYDLESSVIVDTGSDGNLTNNWDRLRDARKVKKPLIIRSGGREMRLWYVGTMMVVVTRTDGQKEVIRVENTYYFPGLHTSVISHQLLNDSGFWFNDRSRTWKHDLISFKTIPYRGLFLADTGHFKLTRRPARPGATSTPSQEAVASTPLQEVVTTTAAGSRLRLPFSTAETAVWHRRLGHPGPEKMELILKQSEGIKLKGPTTV